MTDREELISGELGKRRNNLCWRDSHGRGQRPTGKCLQDSYRMAEEENYAIELADNELELRRNNEEIHRLLPNDDVEDDKIDHRELR